MSSRGHRPSETLALSHHQEETENGLYQRPSASHFESAKEVSSMSIDPPSNRTRVWVDKEDAHSQFALWAVGLSVFVAFLLMLSGVIFAVAYVRGGSPAVSDNWIGFLGAVALLGGLPVSLVTFVLAIMTKIRSEEWRWLWLPLLLFPALLTFVVVGDILWWE